MKARRRGTVYVDYLQNILGKTLATAYSARASSFAGVSTPLEWKEIDDAIDPRDFTISDPRRSDSRPSATVGATAQRETGQPRSGVRENT